MTASRVVLLEACLLALVVAGTARADEKAACIKAHEHGQEVRFANRWVEARTLFLACAQPSCPAPLVKDCTEWSGELALQIPTIVVAAKRPDGSDIDDAKLFVDGALLASRLPSTPIPLDPGDHVLRFEHPGWNATEKRLVLHDGEHERAIQVQFTSGLSVASATPASTHVGAYTATGVAAVVAAGSVAFLVVGKVREHDLATSPCGVAGTCSDAQVNPVRVDYVVSGVAAAAAAVAVGVAAWQFVARRPSPPTAGVSTLRFEF
jgi:hypothetical protein